MEEELYVNKDSTKETIYDKLHTYITNKYILVFNEISHEFLIKLINSNKWNELNISSLTIELAKADLEVRITKLETYLNSEFVPKINPFKEYFKKNESWDGIDHIKNLCSYLKTDDDILFEYHFKKWLVRSVECALEGKKYNKQCLVLAQKEQNSGKTTFCRFICPSRLSKYIAENIGYDKDALIQLAKSFIINLDEIDKIDSKAINAYKSFFSRTNINIRLPYAKKNSSLSRTCSFIGSTNQINFLKDETGNVRWLCFELIEKIDFNYSKDIDINKVWAQAYHLAYNDQSYDSELTPHDVAENEKRNEKYKAFTVEEDLINQLFEKSDKREHFMTATEITNIIKKDHKYVNHIVIGKELNKMGFRRINNQNTGYKGYMIKLREK